MIAVLVAFPILMIATLLYIGLAIHDETPVESLGAGQTGCVSCAQKRATTATLRASMDESIDYENELIAA